MQGHGSDPWSGNQEPGNKILHPAEELSPLATARDPMHHNEKSLGTQQRRCMLQQRPKAATHTQKKQTYSGFTEVDRMVEGTRGYRETR